MTQTILITGSNSGFGRLMAQTLASAGHTVFAGMRDVAGRNAGVASEFREFSGEHGGKIHPVELDPGTDASVEAGVAEVFAATGGSLDILINNAGTGAFGLAEALAPAEFAAMLNVNVLGPQRLARAVLPSMRARKAGLVIFVTSMVGRLVFPTMGPYTASKFAVEALAEAYAYELTTLGVEVAIVQPGAYPTNFLQSSVAPTEDDRVRSYGPLATVPQQMLGGLEYMFSQANAPNPQQVADAVAALIALPVGHRPLRTPVDANDTSGCQAINDLCAQVQAGALQAYGLGNLLPAKPGAAD